MMIGKTGWIGVCVFLSQAGMAMANEVVIVGAGQSSGFSLGVGEPGYGGSGCPQGTARLGTGWNGGVTLEFEEYSAELAAGTKDSVDRANCSIALPISLPQGFRAVLADFQADGWQKLPKATTADITLEAFEAGTQGNHYAAKLVGASSSSNKALSAAVFGDMYKTGCGGDRILRLATAVWAKAKGKHKATRVDIDSLSFAVTLEPCF